MKKSLWAGALAMALGVVPGIVFAQGADEAQKEVDKQVAKAITDAINARVATQVATEATTTATPNNNWVSAGQISLEQKGAGGFDMSIPAILGGWDRDVRGKALTGVSLAYYQFDETLNPSGTQSGIEIESRSISVSPYFAFLLNPNYFITTKLNVGFSYSTSEFRFSTPAFPAGTNTTTVESNTFTFNYGLGGAFNALYRPRNFVLKGAARLDWSAFSSSTDSTSVTRNSSGTIVGSGGSSDSNSDSSTSYGFDGEAGLLIGSRSYLFVNYQWTDSTESNSEASTFASVGFEQKIGRAAALGIKYGTKVGGSDSDPDVQSIFLTFRMGF